MNITLNESNCEVYVFPVEQNKQNKQSKQKNKMFCLIRKCFNRITGRLFKDETFVKNELMAYHPGFNFESVWDYKRRENDFIACVIDKNFFSERRILKPFCRFKLAYQNMEYEFFSSLLFMHSGKKRKAKTVLASFAFSAILSSIMVPVVLSGCGFLTPEANTEETIITSRAANIDTPEQEETSYRPAISFISEIMDTISGLNGVVDKVNYIEEIGGYRAKLILSLNNCDVNETLKKLSLCKEVEKVLVDEVDFISGGCSFSLQVNRKTNVNWTAFHEEDYLDCAETYQIFSELINQSNESHEIQLKTACFDDTNKELTVMLSATKSGYGYLATDIERDLWNQNTVITNIQIEMDSIWETPASFQISLKLKGMKSPLPNAHFDPYEYVPLPCKVKVANVRKDSPSKSVSQAGKRAPGVEIGRVKMDGFFLVYYRTEDGKITSQKE